MSKMISVASGFQYSVNIGFDLGNDEKLKNFIPTKSALSLLEEVLLSTAETSTERSRVLIGAYGKGKSHIVLTILSILLKRDLGLFEKMLPKLEEHPKIKQCVLNYYDSENKILPVVISGSNTSLSQAFLLALQRTLSDNDLLDVMPALCNPDYLGMELIHARLVRQTTCSNGCRCDYTICGDKDPYINEHPEYRDAAGYRRNK